MKLISVYFDFSVLHFNEIPLYGVFVLTFGGALLAGILVHVLVRPYLKKKILAEYELDGVENKSFTVKYENNCVGEEKANLMETPPAGKWKPTYKYYSNHG